MQHMTSQEVYDVSIVTSRLMQDCIKAVTLERRKQSSQNTDLHSGTAGYPSAGTLFAGCHVLVAHGTDCCETSRRE